MKCPLCGQRKGRRRCPAKEALICSHCCGTKRRVVVPCPEDCAFLVGAHAAAWKGRTTERERDHRRLGPFLGSLSDGQQRLFAVLLAGVVDAASRQSDASDHLMLEAVSTLRRTAETRSKGVLYEHQAEDIRAQAVVLELERALEPDDEARRPRDSDLAAALGSFAAALSATISEGAGPTAFLETGRRVVAEIAGMADEEKEPGALVETPRIILPG